ncbi:MAG TPA: hypothetical protein VNA04_10585 [Thermoanaerobaculia bacterium]|nr:hypothetical protein [Thermoanaerobaculia bacterium]
MLRRVMGVLMVIFVTTSASASDFGLREADLHAGESVNGFPNWGERLILAWMNRARVDPQAEMAKCGPACGEAACYAPVPPLAWTAALNRAARFHADEMRRQGYFAHDSKCRIVPSIDSLYPAGCDGSASCACAGGTAGCPANDCTSWMERVSLFGSQPSGEIIALGADPDQSFYLWLFEPFGSPACTFTLQNGHRWLIFKAGGGVGIGYLDSTRAAVADFGLAPPPYRIPSGTHSPRQAASVEMWANWYDTAAPRSAAVVVNGKCTALTLSRGSGTNGAWSATVSGVGSGCHRYYFSFIDSAGREVTYPATGSLGIGCEEWNSTRAVASCPSTSTPGPGRRRAAGRG